MALEKASPFRRVFLHHRLRENSRRGCQNAVLASVIQCGSLGIFSQKTKVGQRIGISDCTWVKLLRRLERCSCSCGHAWLLGDHLCD